MPRGLEVLSTRKHALVLHWEIVASLGGNKRLAALALSHRVPGITRLPNGERSVGEQF